MPIWNTKLRSSLLRDTGPQARPSTAHKPKGNGFSPAIGLVSLLSCSLKMDLEAAFDAVRVAKWSTQLAAGQNWKTLVAATETADMSSDTNHWTPVVGGVSYNTVRSATDTYGWNEVKFGGKHPYTDAPCPGVLAGCAYTIVSNVVTVTVPAQDPPLAAGGQVTIFDAAGGITKGLYTLIAGSNATTAKFNFTHADATGTCNVLLGSAFEKPGIIVSDLISCPSVPRGTTYAADIGQTRPLILVRSHFDGTQGVPGDWYNPGVSDDVPTARNRGRINQLGGSVSTDNVATLSGTYSITKNYVHPLFVIPYYRRATISIAAVGDSTHEATFLSPDQASSWLSRACYDLSTPDKPVVPYNLGMGSGTSKMFFGFAKSMFAVTKPSIAVLQFFTVNDHGGTGANPTQRTVDDEIAAGLEMLDYCQRNGIYPILSTPLPNENYNAAGDGFRKRARAAIIDIAKSRNVAYVDFGNIVGDGATPEKFNPAYKDSIVHENDAAMELMAQALAAIVRQLI